ncbi:hypothetical protein HNR26_002352 [Rhizobium rosettiformans]|uniref:Uncharacterized protein n=2 Tax=Rhizobium rosettiformans TaxID=1368430 RepID=A0A4S8Q7T4_9HYPH|nr:hypothetical protein [Rhizobium rosettiformans]MBB5276300.1 hypothetical protein [Rhizobium rosettiformans]THV36929.1 hypothetical protein FAA86_10615 [Rhizobium rosettiformans W3]
MTITLRSESASELTFEQMDSNLLEVRNYDLSFTATGGSNADEVLWAYIAARPLKLPVALDSSLMTVIGATAALTLVFKKNDIEVGSVTFDAGAATFDFPSEETLNPGDVLTITSSGDYEFVTLALTVRSLIN